jgi:multidrug resistance efflux pump
MRWTIFLFVTLAAAAAVAVTGTNWPHESSRQEPPKRTVSPTERKIFASGFVEGATREVALHFETAGRIADITVHEGAVVVQGDVLARLEATTWENQLRQAQAQHQLAQAELIRLKNGSSEEARRIARARVDIAKVKASGTHRDVLRGEKLRSQDALTEERWDHHSHAYEQAVAELELARANAAEVEAEARVDDVRIAQAKVDLAQAEVRLAEATLEKTRLFAPSAGVILRIEAEPGQIVGPGDRTPVLVMADPSRMHVRAYVEELDALAVRPGQKARITADGKREESFTGTVTFCSPYMTPKRFRTNRPEEHLDVKTREVLIALDEPSDLVIGLPVDVFIEPASVENEAHDGKQAVSTGE